MIDRANLEEWWHKSATLSDKTARKDRTLAIDVSPNRPSRASPATLRPRRSSRFRWA
ncbi:hypothetical protein ACFL59_10905 [Planctomycetota bacterium]